MAKENDEKAKEKLYDDYMSVKRQEVHRPAEVLAIQDEKKKKRRISEILGSVCGFKDDEEEEELLSQQNAGAEAEELKKQQKKRKPSVRAMMESGGLSSQIQKLHKSHDGNSADLSKSKDGNTDRQYLDSSSMQ